MNKNDIKVFCLICDKEVFAATTDPEVWAGSMPGGAIHFTSSGNYGSPLWDPMCDFIELEIFICDPCLLKKKDKVLHCVTHKKNTYDYTPWNPDIHKGV